MENTKYYCGNTYSTSTSAVAQFSRCVVKQCTDGTNEQSCTLTNTLAGTCKDWFAQCGSGTFDNCEIPGDDSSRVACKSNNPDNLANNTSGKCYYTCANGKTYSCAPDKSVPSSIDGMNPAMRGCSDYPPAECTAGDDMAMNDNKLPDPAKGDYGAFNPSSSSGEGAGSSPSNSGEYAHVLAAIHDTLTHANEYYRYDSLNWDWFRGFATDQWLSVESGIQQNTAQIAQNTANTSTAIDNFRKSVDTHFGDLIWEQKKSNNGQTHRDTVLDTLAAETSDFYRETKSIFDSLDASIKRSEQHLKNLDSLEDKGWNTLGTVISGALDPLGTLIGEAASSVIEFLFDDSEVEPTPEDSPDTSLVVAPLPKVDSSLFDTSDVDLPMYDPDQDEEIKSFRDSIEQEIAKRDSAQKESDSVSVAIESLYGDTAANNKLFRDKGLFFSEAGAQGCYEFYYELKIESLGINAPISFNLGNVNGIDLCDMLRKFIYFVTAICVVVLSIKTYIRAFRGGF